MVDYKATVKAVDPGDRNIHTGGRLTSMRIFLSPQGLKYLTL